MHLPGGFLAGFSQGLEQVLAIDVVQVDSLAAVAPAHDVVDGTRVLDAQLAWHGGSEPGVRGKRKPKNEPCKGLTPFFPFLTPEQKV